MDRTLIAILAVGAIIIIATPFVVGPESTKEIPLADRQFLHCPQCHKEFKYTPKMEEEGCPRCGQDTKMVATKESIKDKGPPAGWLLTVLPAWLVEATLLLGATLVYIYFVQKKQKEAEEEFLYFVCDHCHQRLRYSPAKIGRAGLCPRCRHGFVFPPRAEDDETAPRPWWKDWSWLQNLWRGAERKT